MLGNHCVYWSYVDSKMDASSARITAHHASRHPDRLALVVELCSGRLLLPLRRAFSALPLVAPACLPAGRRLAGSVAVALEFVAAGSVKPSRAAFVFDAGLEFVRTLLVNRAAARFTLRSRSAGSKCCAPGCRNFSLVERVFSVRLWLSLATKSPCGY